ncbi:MAG: response regulator transcription factor [Betaproteobacteria bacterium]|nr:response regulator transcription factor [Betaproteobacteria bacterium]
MKSVVLVVDDDPVCLNLTRHLVERADYTFIGAGSIGEARRLAERTPPDIAVVDLMVGTENGLDLVRLWRVEQRFPILIVSGRSEPIDRVIGLEVGADDYLTKPYEPRELQLRLRNALAHSERAARAPRRPSSWLIGSGVFEAIRRAILLDGREVALTTAEFRLVDLLVRHPNQVMTRDQIMDHVQQRERHFATDRSVDMLVARLRRKLSTDGVQIQSIRGAGYMLCGHVERIS